MRTLGALMVAMALFSYAMICVGAEKKKITELRVACTILEQILMQLQWGARPLPELFLQISKGGKNRECAFFFSLYQAMEQLGEKSFQEIWCSRCIDYFSCVPQEDLQTLLCCGEKMGKGDTTYQIQGLQNTLLQLETSYSCQKEKFPVMKKLSYSIAGAASAITVIMFI